MATSTNKETTSPPNKDNHEERQEHRVPLFTVVKNGAILKNIYLLNHLNPSSFLHGPHPIPQDIITVGRHPDCDIVLMHPSISRFHLQITTNPSSHRLFVTDLSSVHGTWVSERKIEPGLQVELKDGDTIRVGGSTRLYRLHWVPLRCAFDSKKPFFPVSDVAAVEDNEEEFTNPAEGNPGEISQEKSFDAKGELMNGFVGRNDNEDLLFSASDVVEVEEYEEERTESVKGDAVEMSKEIFHGICALNYGFVDSGDNENPLFLAPDSAAVENRKECNYPVELETGLELSQEKLFDANGALSYNISGQNDNEYPPFLVFHVAAVEKIKEEHAQFAEFRNDTEASQVKFLGASVSLSHKEEHADCVEETAVEMPQNKNLYPPVIERFKEKIPPPIARKEENEEERNWGQNPTSADHEETRCLESTFESIASLFSNEASGFDVREECPSTFMIPKTGTSSSFFEKDEMEIQSGPDRESRDLPIIKSSRNVTLAKLSPEFSGQLQHLDSDKIGEEGHSAILITEEAENDRFCTYDHVVHNCTIGTGSTDYALLVEGYAGHCVTKEIEASATLYPLQPADEAEENEKVTERERFSTVAGSSSQDEGGSAFGRRGNSGLKTESVCSGSPAAESPDSFSTVEELMPEITYNVKSQFLASDIMATMESMENLENVAPDNHCPLQLGYEAGKEEKSTENGIFNTVISTSSHDDGDSVCRHRGYHSLLNGNVCTGSAAAEPPDSFSPVKEMMSEMTVVVESRAPESNVIATMETMENLDSPSVTRDRSSTNDYIVSNCTVQEESMDCKLLVEDNRMLFVKQEIEASETLYPSPLGYETQEFEASETLVASSHDDEDDIADGREGGCSLLTGSVSVESPPEESLASLSIVIEMMSKITTTIGSQTMESDVIAIMENMENWESDAPESLCPLQLANSHDEGNPALRQEGDCSLLIGIICTEPPLADSLDSFSPVAEMMFELTTNVESQTMESDVISTMGTMESFEIEGPETLCPLQLAFEAEAKENITENGTFNAGVGASFHDDGNNVLGQGGDYVLLTGSVCAASPVAEPLDSFSYVTKIMSEITDLTENQTLESNCIATMESMEIFGSPSSRCEVISSSSDIGSRGSKLCTPHQAQAYSSKRKVRRLAGTGCEFYSEKQRVTKGGSWVKALSHQLGTMDDEIFLSNKENCSPNTLFMKKLRKEENTKVVQALNFCGFSSSRGGFNLNEEMIASKDKENQNPGALQKQKSKRLTFKNRNEADMLLQESRSKRVPLQSLAMNSMGNSKSESLAPGNHTDKSSSVQCSKILENKVKLTGVKKGEWIIVADTTSLLDKESRKSLQLLQGLKGTRLVIPRTVTTELEYLRQCGNIFRRTTEASLALGWIEECLITSKWWILVQTSAENGRESAPTSLASSNQQSRNSKSKTSRLLPFFDCWSRSEIHSPIVEDHVLYCALRYRRMSSSENFVLLSNNISLNIKAMAEGLFCETAQEFRQSLVSPFSERFMWAGSSPRGRTWTVFDDVVLKERYSKKSMGCAKGLQLFL